MTATRTCCARRHAATLSARLDDAPATPSLNGIDYLEVASADQRALDRALPVTRCQGSRARVAGPGAVADRRQASSVDGGVRISARAGRVAATPTGDRPAASTSIGRATSRPTRCAWCVAATRRQPPAGFDPLLAAVDFSFKVDCPSDFDCAPTHALPARADRAEPDIDYLAKDYASFRQLMLDRLASLMPDWQRAHVRRPRLTLVELLAYVGDQLSYYQDAVATEAYLGTARRRISVRRHARLVDYACTTAATRAPGSAFDVTSDQPRGAARRCRPARAADRPATSSGPVDPAGPGQAPRGGRAVMFETMHDVDGSMPIATHEIALLHLERRRVLPAAGATRATLLDRLGGALAAADPGRRPDVRGGARPDHAAGRDADPRTASAVRLTVARTAAARPADEYQVIEIAWAPRRAAVSRSASRRSRSTGWRQRSSSRVSRAGNMRARRPRRTLRSAALGPAGRRRRRRRPVSADAAARSS